MKRRKFTLIEMLVVLCIIGILMSLFLVGVQHAVNAAKRTKFLGAVATMRATLEQYKNKNGAYPAATYDLCYPILGITDNKQKVQNPWSSLADNAPPTDVFSAVDTDGDGVITAGPNNEQVPQSSAAWTKDSKGKWIQSWE